MRFAWPCTASPKAKSGSSFPVKICTLWTCGLPTPPMETSMAISSSWTMSHNTASSANNIASSRATREKMRIGFDARWYNDSGVGTYVAELLRALNALQAQSEFELVVYEDPRNPVPTLDGTSVQRIPLGAGKYSPFGQTALRQRARQDHLDTFHSPFYPIPLGISCPVVVTLHDLIPFLFRISNPLKQFMVKSGYRVAAARSSHIITVSQRTADDVKQFLRVPAENIILIHSVHHDLDR